MIGRLVRILANTKDYNKYARVLKSVGKGYFRVLTEDGYRTIVHVSDLEKVKA